MKLMVDLQDERIVITLDGSRHGLPAATIAGHVHGAVLEALAPAAATLERPTEDLGASAPTELPTSVAQQISSSARQDVRRSAAQQLSNDLTAEPDPPSPVAPGHARANETGLCVGTSTADPAAAGRVLLGGIVLPDDADDDTLRKIAYQLFDRDRTVAQVAALLRIDRDVVRDWKARARW